MNTKRQYEALETALKALTYDEMMSFAQGVAYDVLSSKEAEDPAVIVGLARALIDTAESHVEGEAESET